MMTPRPVRIALCFMIALAVLATKPGSAPAYDLASAANISLYPSPQKVADLVFTNTAGKAVTLKDFRGKVVLLHFWSINCPACRLEEPLLDRLKRQFGPHGLEILGVNLVDPPRSVISHAARKRIPFPVLFDAGRGFRLKVVRMGGKQTAFLLNPAREAILEIPGFPTTYIIDCRGNAVGYSVGAARWNNAMAVNFIQRLLTQSRNCMTDPNHRYSARERQGRRF